MIQSTVLLTTALIADAIKARVTQIIEVYDSAHRIKTTATFYCRFRVMHHLNAPPHFHKIKKKKIEQANQPTNQPTHVPRTESLEHRSSPPATACHRHSSAQCLQSLNGTRRLIVIHYRTEPCGGPPTMNHLHLGSRRAPCTVCQHAPCAMHYALCSHCRPGRLASAAL